MRSSLAWELWDQYIQHTRQWNQLLTRNRVSFPRKKAGKLGMWRRHHRAKAIEQYMPEVRKIASNASRMFARHLDIRDLEQAGFVGLMEAARRYHPDAGPFPAFAYFRVRGAIIDAHKRRQFREDNHDSLQGIAEQNDGWLPMELQVDRSPLQDERFAAAQIETLVAAAIARLSPISQQIIRAIMAGQSAAQIARELGKYDSWTRDQIQIARTALKHALREVVR